VNITTDIAELHGKEGTILVLKDGGYEFTFFRSKDGVLYLIKQYETKTMEDSAALSGGLGDQHMRCSRGVCNVPLTSSVSKAMGRCYTCRSADRLKASEMA
jgi:hypothetical protein